MSLFKAIYETGGNFKFEGTKQNVSEPEKDPDDLPLVDDVLMLLGYKPGVVIKK